MGILSRHWHGDSEDWGHPNVRWEYSSKKDPRFADHGWCRSVSSSGEEIDKSIRAKAASLGVEPPDDIEAGACKS